MMQTSFAQAEFAVQEKSVRYDRLLASWCMRARSTLLRVPKVGSDGQSGSKTAISQGYNENGVMC